MSKKVSLALALGIILVLTIASIAQAQEIRPTPTNIPLNGGSGDGEVRGSIRGMVYEDQNGDGVCSGTEDPAAGGIPVEFTSIDGQHTLFLQSGDEGTYGLVAAGLGTWTVTIRPPENYVATSNPAVQVTLTPEQRVVTGVDFCVRQRGLPGGPGGPGRPGGPGYGGGPGGPPGHYQPPVLLPESGVAAQSASFADNGLWVAGLVGVIFIGMGLVIAGRNRMKSTAEQE